MEVFAKKKGTSLYAYKGDAMTLLAFDLENHLLPNFIGFTIQVKANNRSFYIYNKMTFENSVNIPNIPADDSKLSTEFSPIQKFRWIHVPSTRQFVDNPYFGEYTYIVTPRYLENNTLLPLDKTRSVKVEIDVAPFEDGQIGLSFTRSFISSQAFAYRFNNNLQLRPNRTDLTFDINTEAGLSNRYNPITQQHEPTPFTYEEIHKYLGWQARISVLNFLNEALNDNTISLEVFAYDLNEPEVVRILLELAKVGRLKIILDNYSNHIKPDCYEEKFDAEFKRVALNPSDIFRGKFSSQSHSKIFIQIKNGAATKVLTGSTNFTTNGLYINANHTIIINNASVAQTYSDIFKNSFGKSLMSKFKKQDFANKDFVFENIAGLPNMTIRFSPHPEPYTISLFDKISTKILNAESDVLFAVMIDKSESSILDALKTQVKADTIFTAGITDSYSDMSLYKPGRKNGIKILALKIATKLPPPFNDIIGVPGMGHVIHHKFVVVDFKGSNPVVYCGSSNLAFNPEQKNGDNLIEFRDRDIVTAFAIEAIRLTDHYAWLNRLLVEDKTEDTMTLPDGTGPNPWYKKYYDPNDLKFLERTLLMK